ncbi:MAG: hypothetical protein ACTHKQ_16190, partial [Mesorhizobium sp.]
MLAGHRFRDGLTVFQKGSESHPLGRVRATPDALPGRQLPLDRFTETVKRSISLFSRICATPDDS